MADMLDKVDKATTGAWEVAKIVISIFLTSFVVIISILYFSGIAVNELGEESNIKAQQTAVTPSDLIKAESRCETHAELAERIMSNHQVGVPMSKVLAILAPKGPTPTPMDIFDKESVIEAYSSPRYNSEKVQQSAIADFRDQRHVDCIKLVNQLYYSIINL